MTAANAYTKHGMLRSNISFISRKLCVIPSNLRDCFKRYYLLYWAPEYLVAQLSKPENQDGILHHQGIAFNIVWHGITPTQLKTESYMQIALSFREPQPEFSLPATVLIYVRKQIQTIES